MLPEVSPPIQADLAALAPIFRGPFEAWLRQAAATFPQIEFRVTETRRTLNRQLWLFAQGREAQFMSKPVVTWTVESRHRYGLAADVAMIRRSTRTAVWEVSSWLWLYQVVPPEHYGLRTLAPTEYAHLELYFAEAVIRDARAFGVHRS